MYCRHEAYYCTYADMCIIYLPIPIYTMAPVESNFELVKDKCVETWAVLYKFLRECEYFTVLFFLYVSGIFYVNKPYYKYPLMIQFYVSFV